MQKAIVRASACGFRTSIVAASEDAQHVHLEIKLLASDFPLIDGYQEISDGFEGAIFQRVRNTLQGCCSGCVVPSGLFKAMQAAAGLSLPVDAGIQFERE